MISTISTNGEDADSVGSFRRVYIWMVASAAALGGLLFGYDWLVIGGAKPSYEIYFHLTSPEQQGWAMSCALIGCIAGALAVGRLSDRFGRKHSRVVTIEG